MRGIAVGDVDLLRHLEIRQALLAECNDIGVFRCLSRLLFQHDRGFHFFSPHGMRDAETHRFGNGRMGQQNFVDFARANFFAAAVDQFLDAPGERQITVGIQEILGRPCGTSHW